MVSLVKLARLLRHLQAGTLEPGAVRRLLAGLDAGHAEGAARPAAPACLPPPPPFSPFPASERDSVLLPTRPARAAATRAEARERVAAGQIVTVLNLSPTALYHRVRFDPAGYWDQSGGLFGRAERDEPLFTSNSRAARVRREHGRISPLRGLRKG